MSTMSTAYETTYQWPGFRLVADHDRGTVTTHYGDGASSPTSVGPDDRYHADLLGITPFAHRLAHELAHHIVSLARGTGDGRTGCRVVWRAAHREPQPEPEAGTDEWYVTAVLYYAHGARLRHADDYGALADLARSGVDLPALAVRLRWLLDAPEHAERVLVRVAERRPDRAP